MLHSFKYQNIGNHVSLSIRFKEANHEEDPAPSHLPSPSYSTRVVHYDQRGPRPSFRDPDER